MTSFNWKRKAGDKLAKGSKLKKAFEDEDEIIDATSLEIHSSHINQFRRKKIKLLDNCQLKSQELKQEGIKFAENNQYFEAVAAWDKALKLTPSDAKILEMKAQALLQLNQPFPALQAARKATMINPQWWVAHQTMGRAQLGIGEIKMAIISFSIAIHLNPACQELWTEDLQWAVKLQHEKNKLALEEQTEQPDNDKTSTEVSVNRRNVDNFELNIVQSRTFRC